MLFQIAVGTCLLLVNVCLSAIAAMLLEDIFRLAHPWLMREPHRPRLVLLLIGTSLWVLGVVTMGVWIWAAAYLALGAFDTLEQALYFSLEAYTTLGLGDVVPDRQWRILSGMEAANGLLSFGLLTALLIDALRQVRQGQGDHRRKRDD